jgi:glyceraldehyde 3-phosphate dehydrogenase
MRVGINGLGRIGRAILRQLWDKGTHVCAHINDINCDIENIAYLILYDSISGKFPGEVKVSTPRKITLQTDRKCWEIEVSNQPLITNIDWSGVECLIDSSGRDDNALAARTIKVPGLNHVIITHTFAESDFTLVFGVNDGLFDPSRHRIVSSSICDASAIAPVLKIISDECGLKQCFVTTLHPWLSYQNIMDGPLRSQANPPLSYDYYPLGRASVGSLIPKPTTVGFVLESLIPVLKDRVFAMSYRVPTSVVASADISLVTNSRITIELLRSLLTSLNEHWFRCSKEMLISSDHRGETASAVIDLRWLEVHDNHYVKLVLWYDNEWGYSARVIDLLDRIRIAS